MKDYKQIIERAEKILELFSQILRYCDWEKSGIIAQNQDNKGVSCINRYFDEHKAITLHLFKDKGEIIHRTNPGHTSIMFPGSTQIIDVNSGNLLNIFFLLVVMCFPLFRTPPYQRVKHFQILLHTYFGHTYNINDLICVALKNEYSNLIVSNVWREFFKSLNLNVDYRCLRSGEVGGKDALEMAILDKKEMIAMALIDLGAKPSWLTPQYLYERCQIPAENLEEQPGTCSISFLPESKFCVTTPTWAELLDYYGYNTRTVTDSKNIFFYGLYLGVLSQLLRKSSLSNILVVASLLLQLFLIFISGTWLSASAGFATTIALKKFGIFSDRKTQMVGVGVSCLIQTASRPLNEAFYNVATCSSSIAGDYAGRTLVDACSRGHQLISDRISGLTKFGRFTKELLIEHKNRSSYLSLLPVEVIKDHVLTCLNPTVNSSQERNNHPQLS